MIRRLVLAVFALVCICPAVASESPPSNPAIDIDQHLRIAAEAARHRDTRRVTEERFLEMSRLPGAVVLDARSKEKYEELHVRDAMHLSFPDLTFESLRRTSLRRSPVADSRLPGEDSAGRRTA